jgi:hypothetical protein
MPRRILEYQANSDARLQLLGRGRHALNVAIFAPLLVVGFTALMWFISRDSIRVWSAITLFGLQAVWIIIAIKCSFAWLEGGRSRLLGLCAVTLTTMWVLAVGVFTLFHR